MNIPLNAGLMKKQRSGLRKSNTVDELHFRSVTKNITSYITVSIVVFLLMTMLFACKNEMQEIKSLDFSDTLPDLSARDIEMIFSESALVQVKLVSPRLISIESQDPYREFPEGFVVYFYDSLMNVKSFIKADYGIDREKQKLMEARYNVVVENLETNERLNTEELFWDQSTEKIYTNKFVRITRGDEVITGDGMVSDQSFESIEIINPKGLIEIGDEEEL
jgi:LPS export ABC transporter protein LptC